MQSRPPAFPLIVVLLGRGSETVETAVSAAMERAPSPPGVLLTRLENPASSRDSPLTAELDLIEEADALFVISAASGSAEEPQQRTLLNFANAVGCPVVRFASTNGESTGDWPTPPRTRDDWLPAHFAAAGLSPDADLPAIYEKMDAFANQAAPSTRKWRHWIVFLQGLAVLAPMCWLIRHLLGLPGPITAALSLGSVVLLVGVNWWLRWRGMQKTWARARLVAEAARSRLATASCPASLPPPDLHLVPALRHLRWHQDTTAAPPPGDWRERYLQERLDPQADYFSRKRAEAEAQRTRLTRWATLLLDLMLVFALAGVVLYMSETARLWVRAAGGAWPEVTLGLAGALLPVGLLLVEALRTLQELNRRTARFAQQSRTVERARLHLQNTPSESAALAIVADTERQLLAEVFEWYFETETAEHFFQLRQAKESTHGLKLDSRPRRFAFAARAIALLGIAGFFFLRVVLGRVLWMTGAGVAVIGLVFYYQPLARQHELQDLGVLRDANGEPWEPMTKRADNGCVLIVHGLRGDITPRAGQDLPWMRRMAAAIEKRAGNAPPNIGLLDWHRAARPTAHFQLGFGATLPDFLGDLAAIHPQALEVGNALTVRIFEWIQEGRIRRDRPLYLIGHSAGGFVVTRLALRLKRLGAAPEPLRLVLLDTPDPDAELLIDLPRLLPGAADYYITSPLVRLDPATAPDGLRVRRETPPTPLGWLAAHSYAPEWFLQTIERPGSGEGFDLTPLRLPSPPP